MPDFWFAGGTRDQGLGRIDVIPKVGKRRTISVNATPHLYSFEIDAAGEAIRAGRQEFSPPGMTWADSLGNARVLDQWRAAAGLEYEIEKPARRTLHARRAASSRPARRSRGGRSPDCRRSSRWSRWASRISAPSRPGAILLDAFFEAGGNVFDTAFVYGAGYTETLFGDWHSSRGVRKQAVLIGKGAHTPLCYPEMIGKQLTQSLERLKTDYVDVYFMHRDNPDVPVGEFVDAMDAEVKKGRIRGIFGGSNWERDADRRGERLREAAGKQGFGAISNNFALAEMQDIIWPGCVSSSSDDWKAWLKERQLPNFAWSSQARGFFTDRAGRDKRDNEEWCASGTPSETSSDATVRSSSRKKLGKSPIHVALAYVLGAAVPGRPADRPAHLQELDDSLKGLSISG